MTRISFPGNKRWERGFALPDALLCLFVTGVILLILQGASVSLSRFAFKTVTNIHSIIEDRNMLEPGNAGVNDADWRDGNEYEKQ
jgi:Tfp pilus assembly protein PilV